MLVACAGGGFFFNNINDRLRRRRTKRSYVFNRRRFNDTNALQYLHVVFERETHKRIAAGVPPSAFRMKQGARAVSDIRVQDTYTRIYYLKVADDRSSKSMRTTEDTGRDLLLKRLPVSAGTTLYS